MTDRSHVEKYRKQGLSYLANASKMMEANEADKAAELLWGSVAKALKAVARKKGFTLRTHSQLRDFARSLALELGDMDLFRDFQLASSLHSNFYESELSRGDVALAALNIRALVGKLLSLVPSSS